MIRNASAHFAYSRPLRVKDENDEIDVQNPKRIDDKWFFISNLS